MPIKLERFLARLVPVGLVVVISAVSAGAQPAAALGTVRYAKPGGMSSGTCSDWANACELRYVLGSVAVSGDQIWVAAGTYKPTTSTDRFISFVLKDGVGLYGGFAGTETSPSQRDPKANVTILSGAIGMGGPSDNSYHVVMATNPSSAVLDGFTITGGSSMAGMGGGMLLTASSPTLANLIFRMNYAGMGGGLMLYDRANPTLTNVTFSGNAAVDLYGGGMFSWQSSPVLTNVTFVGNHAAMFGGGMQVSDGSDPTLKNVTFSANVAELGGALAIGPYSQASLTNVTFSGNAATNCGAAIYMYRSTSGIPSATLSNVILWEDEAPLNPEICNPGSYPLDISYSVIAGGCDSIAGATCGAGNLSTDPKLGALANNGGYTPSMPLMPGSSAIDTGTNSGCPPTDQRGAPRPQNLQCDIGAYELGQPRLRQLHPSDGIFACLRPEIGVTLELTDLVRTGGSFDPAKVVLTLDGMDVTGAASFFETESYPASLATLLYTPAADLAAGTHYVALTYPSDTGTLWRSWNFTAADIPCGTSPGLAPAPTIPAVLPPLQPSAPPVPIMPILP